MSADNFELILRAQMKSRAAELDRSLRPAPQLGTLLDSPAGATRRFATAPLRFGLGVVAVLALALIVLAGAWHIQAPSGAQPVASLTPTPSPASPSPTLVSPPPSRASPTIAIEQEPAVA